MLNEAIPINMTESGLVYTGACRLLGMQIGMDAINDPQITVYDNITDSGNEVVPTNAYNASVYGLNGFTAGYTKRCFYGLYIVIEAVGGGVFSGACTVVLDVAPG